jgi:pimeloyl-ACP methyl ester carboxylesterase
MGAAGTHLSLGNGITLSYTAQGDPFGPALVLLPGPTDSLRSYEPVLPWLSPAIRTLAVSQRGHGDSTKPRAGYGVQDFAADTVSLLDGLGIERAVLAGHSGSCLGARRVAIDHPDRVAGLVLEASPTTLRSHRGLEDFVDSIVSRLSDPIDPAFARSVITDTSSESLADELVDDLAGELLKVPAHVWHEMFSDLLAYDDLDELERITAPTMLIWGERDRIVGREMQDALRSWIRGAALIVYEDVGHTPRWEDPRRFATDVNDFVTGLRAPGL